MGDFSAEWLALREPADHAARSARLTHAVVDALRPEPSPRILDLATGTGSNFRYLNAACPRAQWLLVDRDAALLARVPTTQSVEARQVNLATLDDRSLFAGRALVTASALLDLVSAQWLQAVCAACQRERSAVLFALSYDGRMNCRPEEPEDELVRNLVNRHQHTDEQTHYARNVEQPQNDQEQP
jgi:trans-aconitate methyltransferase